MSILVECALVELDEGGESAGVPADDRQHQRQAVAGGADHRVGAATNTDPGGEMSRWERRAHVLVDERRSGGAGPRDGLVTEQAREEVELLLEQRLVVGEIESEQRERVGERAASDDQLGAAV